MRAGTRLPPIWPDPKRAFSGRAYATRKLILVKLILVNRNFLANRNFGRPDQGIFQVL